MGERNFLGKVYSAFFEQEFPADLTLVVLWFELCVCVVYLPILNVTILKFIFALPAILFIPGYCLIAALFPKKDDIGISERIALSIGLSVAVVPLIGLGLNFTPFGIRLDTVIITLMLFILVTVLAAYYRRGLLLPEEKFRVSFFEIAGNLSHVIFPKEGRRTERFLSVFLALIIMASMIITIYVIVVPKEGERFTEFFVLGENKMATNYPDQIVTGQNYPMYIGVANREYRNITYTIETWGVLMEFNSATNTSRIIAMDPLWRHSFTLANNETMNIPYNLSVEKAGYNRIEFLLFNETIPSPDVVREDRISASNQDLHLWISVH